MQAHANIVSSAFLIADPARLAMLVSLLDGRARPAGELARAAGVTAQTASSHLGKLLDGGLLRVETEGRHRYYRLADAHVAFALENLAAIGPREPAPARATAPHARALRFARCCYDHLAGRLGVALTQQLQARGLIVAAADKRFEITPDGHAWFAGLGIDTGALASARRGVARQCLDSTERRHHLAGPLGTRLLACLCEQGWLRRTPSSRALDVTPRGWAELQARLGIDVDALAEEPATPGDAQGARARS
jgi:DNA-binding transcriptional ArsR family regulator